MTTHLAADLSALRERAPLRFAVYGFITMIGLCLLLLPLGFGLGALLGAVFGVIAALMAVGAFGAAILTALIPEDEIAAALARHDPREST
jgi:hypothetical protein